ncbi:MAG TPA: RIP metalloprotease RseP [Gammaproteobacteria bacterium]|jgi:regulator of sigma E protease|nr:RIP metalloprotease RseP [Gammaproteobacteria bacterium]
MSFIISVIAFIVAIGVLVTVHEFGHFIVARSLGIRVLRFSIGFGKPLFTWMRRGDPTEYVIAALPLGGYVKMLDEREGEVLPADQPYAFNRQPLHKRFAVVIAGPAFNLLFAVLAYWVIFMVGVPGVKPVVGDIRSGSIAAAAGFESQDQIEAINDEPTPTWETAMLRLFEGVMHGGTVTVQVLTQHGNRRTLTMDIKDSATLTEPGKLLDGLGLSEWMPDIPPVLGQIADDGTAFAAGLKSGDRVVSLAGVPVKSWQQLVKILRGSPGKTVDIVVERQGHNLSLKLPIGIQGTEEGQEIGHIGAGVRIPADFGARLRAEQRYNPAVALWHAVKRTAGLSWLTLDAAGNMVLGNVSWHNLSGPINIAQYAGYSAEGGLVPFLMFLAIVSISLGVLNLLPIPLLDGGHVLYYAVELVKGSPVSLRTEIMGQRVGIALLLMLMVFAVYNDLSRLLS